MRTRSLLLCSALTLTGCASHPTQTSQRPHPSPVESTRSLEPADLDLLTGAPWSGTLTYLDYTTGKPTTIASTLTVRRIAADLPTWELRVGYPKEPGADSVQTIVLKNNTIGNESILSRRTLPDGGIEFITSAPGTDDNKPATFRFVHRLTPTIYSRTKLVTFVGQSTELQRHIYSWSR